MRAAASATARAVPTNPSPDAELAAIKARARRAYMDAKRKGAAPPAMCDRLHADTLLAIDGAPPRAATVMAYRTELLFRLLMPIQPTGFDRAFRALGIDFSTLRQCSRENYATYNQTLAALRPLIEASAGLKNLRLIDAHSFCWIFSSLLKLESEGSIAKVPGRKDEGRIFGGREKSIIAMRLSVENTVKNANGQIVQRILKNKELRMTSAELEKLIASLLDLQDNCCALTGIPFQFLDPEADKNLLPSLDRIDSDGHYETGNLQVVCQFINFWKGDKDNEEFRRLLMLVRGVEAQ